MIQKLTSKSLLILIYLASLLYSMGYALPLYVNSSFLAKFVSTEEAIGLVFSLGALLSILAILTLPRILARFGNYRTTLSIVILEIACLLLIATLSNPLLIIGLFVINQVLLNVIYLNLNALLEAFSGNSSTGSIRGLFLTVINAAVLIAPFLGGLILTDGDYEKLYLAAAGFLAGVLIVLHLNFKKYIDPHYETPSLRETYTTVWKNHDIHAIIGVQFLLNFFYAWMIIYTPLYLNQTMGIPMNEILGVIIPIALLPFVIFQIILGKIADEKLGEKEILVASFIILVLSSALLSFITTKETLIWALALFVTRVGASAIEVMSESYFYKQINPSDVHIITFTYVVRSSAYLIAPIFGSLLLLTVDTKFIFTALALIMMIGIPLSLHFKDSR